MIKLSNIELVYLSDNTTLSHVIITFETYEIIVDALNGNFYEFDLN